MPQLPAPVKEALGRCSALADRLLGAKGPELSLSELSRLDQALAVIRNDANVGPDTSIAFVEALAKLVAWACRKDISGSDERREELLLSIADSAVFVAGQVFLARSAASGPAEDVAGDLVGAILKGQAPHAAARQTAAVAAVLASPERLAGLSADSAARLRMRAACMAGTTLHLLESLAILAIRRLDRSMGEALLAALRESRLLEHFGRVLLLLPPPGPGEQPASAILAQAQALTYSCLCRAVQAYCDVAVYVEGDSIHGVPPLLGGCGIHALLALGASTLAAADGGPCGLPRNPLLAPSTAPDELYPCINGDGINVFVLALSHDLRSAAPSLPRRAAIRLLVRTLQLAGASARVMRAVAGERAVQVTQQGKLGVDLSWSGGRRQDAQEFGHLLPLDEVIRTAAGAIDVLVSIPVELERAWAAEAPAVLAALFTCVRHCQQAFAFEKDSRITQTIVGAVATLVTRVTDPMTFGSGFRMLESPADLPAPMAAALRGGFVSLLETLLRAAGDSPTGPEAAVAVKGTAGSVELGRGLVALLAHSPPRQAAAFLATLAKLLKRAPPLALLEPGHLVRGSQLMEAGLILATNLVSCLLAAGNVGVEPPGPVDPSLPCSPHFVLALVALQLLPVLSRLTREAAQLGRGARAAPTGPQPEPEPEPRGGSPSSAGRSSRAARQTESDDGDRPMHQLLWLQLRLLSGAVSRAGLLQGISPRPSRTRAFAVVCVPFLVEACGAGLLLGALLAALLRDGRLPGVGRDQPEFLLLLGECCVGLAAASVQAGGGGGGGSGSSAASAAWSPAALRLLASRLTSSEPRLSEELEALAARLEQPLPTVEAPPEGSRWAGELAGAAERLAALRAEALEVLPPACSNPACVSLAGDSEVGVRLQHCSRCGQASYCCRECQVAHWKAGHKEACGGLGGGSTTG